MRLHFCGNFGFLLDFLLDAKTISISYVILSMDFFHICSYYYEYGIYRYSYDYMNFIMDMEWSGCWSMMIDLMY